MPRPARAIWERLDTRVPWGPTSGPNLDTDQSIQKRHPKGPESQASPAGRQRLWVLLVSPSHDAQHRQQVFRMAAHHAHLADAAHRAVELVQVGAAVGHQAARGLVAEPGHAHVPARPPRRRPFSSAGIRVEPPMSAVAPQGAPSAATSAAVPPLEPPGLRCCPKGFRLRPYLGAPFPGPFRR